MEDITDRKQAEERVTPRIMTLSPGWQITSAELAEKHLPRHAGASTG